MVLCDDSHRVFGVHRHFGVVGTKLIGNEDFAIARHSLFVVAALFGDWPPGQRHECHAPYGRCRARLSGLLLRLGASTNAETHYTRFRALFSIGHGCSACRRNPLQRHPFGCREQDYWFFWLQLECGGGDRLPTEFAAFATKRVAKVKLESVERLPVESPPLQETERTFRRRARETSVDYRLLQRRRNSCCRVDHGNAGQVRWLHPQFLQAPSPRVRRIWRNAWRNPICDMLGPGTTVFPRGTRAGRDGWAKRFKPPLNISRSPLRLSCHLSAANTEAMSSKTRGGKILVGIHIRPSMTSKRKSLQARFRRLSTRQ